MKGRREPQFTDTSFNLSNQSAEEEVKADEGAHARPNADQLPTAETQQPAANFNLNNPSTIPTHPLNQVEGPSIDHQAAMWDLIFQTDDPDSAALNGANRPPFDMNESSLHTVIQENQIIDPVREVLGEQHINIQQNNVDLNNNLAQVEDVLEENRNRLEEVIAIASDDSLLNNHSSWFFWFFNNWTLGGFAGFAILACLTVWGLYLSITHRSALFNHIYSSMPRIFPNYGGSGPSSTTVTNPPQLREVTENLIPTNAQNPLPGSNPSLPQSRRTDFLMGSFAGWGVYAMFRYLRLLWGNFFKRR
jgi:hypothetical protein